VLDVETCFVPASGVQCPFVHQIYLNHRGSVECWHSESCAPSFVGLDWALVLLEYDLKVSCLAVAGAGIVGGADLLSIFEK
jgi:hypothetical protein